MLKRSTLRKSTQFLAAAALTATIVTPAVQAEEVVATSTIADARTAEKGSVVTIQGTITTAQGFAGSNAAFYVQDETGGVFVYTRDTGFAVGDVVEITGTTDEYNGEIQISGTPTITKVAAGEAVVAEAGWVTANNQGQLVALEDVTITDLVAQGDKGTFEFKATKDGQEPLTVRVDYRSGYTYEQFIEAGYNDGDIVTVEGIAANFNGTLQLKALGDAFTLVQDGVATEKEEVAISPIADVRHVDNGTAVKFQGVITTKPGFNGSKAFYVQDETGGVYVYSSHAGLSVGQEVVVEGTHDIYNNEIQIRPTAIEVVGTKALPQPVMTTAEALNAEHLGKRVQLEQVTITEIVTDSYDNFTFTILEKDGKTVQVHNDSRGGLTGTEFKAVYKEGDIVNVTGVAGNYRADDVFRVQVTGLQDFAGELTSSRANEYVKANTAIALQTIYADADIYYTTDGSEPTTESTVYNGEIMVVEDITIKALIVHNGKEITQTFTYQVAPFHNDKKIGDIQGAAHTSPFVNDFVEVAGVVTHVADSGNFVIQGEADGNNDTSDAIYVAYEDHGFAVGDVVTVDGQVRELGGGTDLTTTTIVAEQVTKTATAALPTALLIGEDVKAPAKVIDNDQFATFDPAEDAIDFYESLEGMRVAVKDAKIVAPQSGGVVTVVPSAIADTLTFNNTGGLNIAKDNYNTERILVSAGVDVKAGDAFKGNIVGVMGYDSDNFKLYTTEALPELVVADVTTDVTHIEPAADKVTVAAYNIENFSATTTADKVKGIAKHIAENLQTPDVVTLTEVQDNDGSKDTGVTDASESYEVLIAAIKELTGVEYKWTDIAPENNQDGGAPGANIRPGFLYNPERVTLHEGEKGSATDGVEWTNTGDLTLNPGRVMEHQQENTRKALAAQFTLNTTGEDFIVIGAHLNSKGGDTPLFGNIQPAQLHSEAERVALATAINAFIKKGLAKNKDANIIVAGDMNDFEFSAPLTALKGAELTNMIDVADAADRYTYSFQGNNQVLDHILVTNSMAKDAQVDVIHVNTNVLEGSFSDHDPVLVQVALQPKSTVIPGLPVVPTEPVTPVEPTQPVLPEEPTEPEVPVTPEEPTTPVEPEAPTAPFTDIADSYSANAIAALYAAGITTGTTPTTFEPKATMTRAQFAVMIARALKLEAKAATAFTDVKGKWYAQEVQALVEAGIVTGKTATTFEPGSLITRQQAATMIVRMMEYKGHTFAETDVSYTDVAAISPYAQPAVAKLFGANIMTGDDNVFSPQANLTRQQMAKILYEALVEVNVLK